MLLLGYLLYSKHNVFKRSKRGQQKTPLEGASNYT